ncbi:MAG: hypothetical protein IJY99_04130 [Alphaproteobacteria bacterium]|nr:hypothetical protein [Alphaproteobacteria bacterium]
MRMLITIFSFLFILGVHNTAHTAVTYDFCSTRKEPGTCNTTAGCYYDLNGKSCNSCSGGTYKGTNGGLCTTCPSDGLYTGKVGTINAVMIDTSKGGLTSVDECAWKSFCHNENKYLIDFRKDSAGCEYCQARNKPENNEYYYLYADSDDSQTGTLGDATTNYFDKFCRKCGKNTQETKNGATSCRCKTGYVADNKTKATETRDDDCKPEQHTITYYCNVGETAVSLFTQSYANIDSPCYEKNTIDYCPSNTESPDYETCKKKHIHFLKYDDRFFIPYFLSQKEVTKGDTYESYNQTWCVDYYAPSPLHSCKKRGHAIIGWYSEKQKVAFATTGSTTDITSVLGTSYTIHSDQLTYKWTDNLDLYPIWKQKIIDCDPGYYLNNANEACFVCPAGYYCPGVSDGTIDAEDPKDIGLSPCPLGSTSDANSDAITDCYLKPAVKCGASSDAITDCYSGTKFCGASTGDCIYMPVSAERAYYTNPTETSAQ